MPVRDTTPGLPRANKGVPLQVTTVDDTKKAEDDATKTDLFASTCALCLGPASNGRRSSVTHEGRKVEVRYCARCDARYPQPLSRHDFYYVHMTIGQNVGRMLRGEV